MAARKVHEGAALERALKQGALDNLCGLYAAINAIRVVAAPTTPLTRNQTASLFTFGMQWLEERSLLLPTLSEGMEKNVQFALTETIAAQLNATSGVALSVSRPSTSAKSFSRPQLITAIDTGIGENAAMIVCLEATLAHYTVFVGHSQTRYYCFDSTGLRWIRRESLGVLSARSNKRHQIGRSGVVRVRLSG